MNLAALTENQAKDLGLEDDAKHEYIAAKATKSNYAPAGGTVFLRRGEHGVLTYHEPSEAHRATVSSLWVRGFLGARLQRTTFRYRQDHSLRNA
jgi:hypothetical protein